MSRAGLATLAVVSLLAAWLGYAAGEHTRADARTIVAAKVPASKSAAAAAAPNLPSTSIAARYADLARRAEDGDGAAALELAKSLWSCAETQASDRSFFLSQVWFGPLSRSERHNGGDFEQARSDALRRFQTLLADREDASRRDCAGVTRTEIESYPHWLYKAGEAGDTASALKYGRGDFIYDGEDLLGHLEELAFWREHAEDMLQRALAGNDPQALLPLAEGYDPASSPRWMTGAVFDPDPVKAYAYYLAASERNPALDSGLEPRLQRLDATLTDAQRDAARQLAAELCATDLCARVQRH